MYQMKQISLHFALHPSQIIKEKRGRDVVMVVGGLWIVLATKHIGLSHKENKIPLGNLAVNG